MPDLRGTDQTTERRIAFLGTGYIADWHAQCIASVGGVKLVAVCDRILSKAQALANKYGVAKVYGSLEEMLAAEKLDAVHILLPPNLHFGAAKTILEAGVDVFLEKPMCDRADDCDTLVRLAAGRRLGVAHNFLFAPPYEQLRSDLRSGILGHIDAVTITWNRPLPQTIFGPFDIWMLRDPRNIMSEVGSHSVAHLLDLVGEPEHIDAHASNPIELPTGKTFYRRWLIEAYKDRTVAELRFSFVPGFSEYGIHVRGSLASGTVDFERNTYTLQQHRPSDPDFDSYAMVVGQAKSLMQQARRTLKRYILSKLKIEKRGNPYGESIARAMDAFYAPVALPDIDDRVSGATGAKVIRICEAMAAAAKLPEMVLAPAPAVNAKSAARILVLGGTGFLGKEVVRQLVASGESVRLLVRNAASVPPDVRAAVECAIGDVGSRQDLLNAMRGVECVIHLARANVKSWADYKEYEVEATRRVAECALEAGVKRLVYTGTIGSYYAGARAGTITEATPLIPEKIKNFYGRAKAESEALLLQMCREKDLPVVILRPGIVIGRGGSPFHWGVGTWWHDSVCQIWGAGENKLPFVLVQDVARGILAAVTTPGIEGQSFNLIGDPCLSAQEYLDELDRCGNMRIQRHATPILRFYLLDMLKWVVKIAVRHPERQMPSYYDWEGRTQRAIFDCTAAKTALGWKPATSRDDLVRLGIAEPLKEFTE